MKKLLFVFFAFLLLCSFGCSKKTDDPKPNPDPDPVQPDDETPKEEEKQFEVTFVTNCSTTVEKQTVKKADEINLPTLNKEGYTFKGFYLDSEFKNAFDKATYNITSDITLYALFEVNKFTVKFVVDGNTVDEQTVEYNGSATAPSDPEKTGYDFKGWDKDFSKITDDLTVLAKFSPKTFTVNFRLTEDSQTYYDIQEVEYGQDAEEPLDPTRTGYEFLGWDKNYTNIKADLIVTALWEANVYNVKYIVKGQVYAEVEVEYGKAPTPPADPTLEGYDFTGWDKTPESVEYDIVISATFSAKSYTIKYFSGETELALEPATYTYGEEMYLPKNEVSGYIFAGWYLDSEFKTTSIGAISKTQTGDLVLYSLNVKVDFGTLASSWTFDGFDSTHTAAKGIDAVSNLPEQYEKDFYKFLVDNDHLNDPRLHATMKVSSWEEFSGVNPNHNGDPQRIWNDTSTNYVGGADGYSAFFLFDELVLDDDGFLLDIKGGFLGTEPYKTKYWNLTYSLVQMVQSKYNNINFKESSAVNNGFFAFVIDGYFYGTQGVGEGVFNKLRYVVPTTTTYYKVENNTVNAYTREYTNTTDFSSLNTALAIPVVEGKVFVGWYLDSELTKSVLDNTVTQFATLYPKFE